MKSPYGVAELVNEYCVNCPRFHFSDISDTPPCDWHNDPWSCPIIHYLEFNKKKNKEKE